MRPALITPLTNRQQFGLEGVDWDSLVEPSTANIYDIGSLRKSVCTFNTDKLKFLKIYCESGIQKRDLCSMDTQYFVKIIYF